MVHRLQRFCMAVPAQGGAALALACAGQSTPRMQQGCVQNACCALLQAPACSSSTGDANKPSLWLPPRLGCRQLRRVVALSQLLVCMQACLSVCLGNPLSPAPHLQPKTECLSSALAPPVLPSVFHSC